jgi:hypothetical protein
MANLDGSRSHGARWDALAGAILRDDPTRFTQTYRVLLHAARAEGIGPEEFGNGEQLYAKQGQVIELPTRRPDRPNREFLEWHLDEVFKAS